MVLFRHTNNKNPMMSRDVSTNLWLLAVYQMQSYSHWMSDCSHQNLKESVFRWSALHGMWPERSSCVGCKPLRMASVTSDFADRTCPIHYERRSFHGRRGAAEKWGGMTSLPVRMQQCGGGEGGLRCLVNMTLTPLWYCDRWHGQAPKK